MFCDLSDFELAEFTEFNESSAQFKKNSISLAKSFPGLHFLLVHLSLN